MFSKQLTDLPLPDAVISDVSLVDARIVNPLPSCPGVSILRHVSHVTKSYPCGLCVGLDYWSTRPQDHFLKMHSGNPVVIEIARLQDIAKNEHDPSNKAKVIASLKKIQATLLNSSLYQHNQRVVIQRKGMLLSVQSCGYLAYTREVTDIT